MKSVYVPTPTTRNAGEGCLTKSVCVVFNEVTTNGIFANTVSLATTIDDYSLNKAAFV